MAKEAKPAFDPRRETLVVETNTIWPEEFAAVAPQQRACVEERLHANPQQAAKLEYVRLPTGFCRQITVTAEDLERFK